MPAALDIDLLRSFVAIADAGSLSLAAPRIGRTQSALSMQVRRLEDVAGATLFHRSQKGVSLTMQGERLLAHAREILRSHDRAVADLAGQVFSGSFRFGCPDDYAVSFLPKLIRDFTEQHPGVFIEVVCASTPSLLQALAERRLDSALVSVLVDEAAPSSRSRGALVTRDTVLRPADCIRLEPLVWVARPDFVPDPFAPLPLALGAPDTHDHGCALAALATLDWPYRIAYASISLSGLLATVRSGHAAAVLTRSAIPPDLKEIAPEHGLPRLPVLGIVLAPDPEHSEAPPAVAAFAAHVRATLPGV